MATVVLLGCSTSGKSSAARRFNQVYGNQFKVIDTDAVVAAEDEFRGHLYAMFMKFAKDADVSAARLYLELGERHFLRQQYESFDARFSASIMIAAGPNVALRELEWSNFLRERNPICFYFKLSARELYDGLRRRRQRQSSNGLDLCPGFGSWDNGLLTRFNEQTLMWDELPKEESLALLEKHLAVVDPVYSKACEPQNIIEAGMLKDQASKNKLNGMFLSCLRMTPTDSRFDLVDQYTPSASSQMLLPAI